MIEGVKNLKVNNKYADTPCIWCNDALVLGEDASICEACGTAHHATCWSEHQGCGKKNCLNAYFKETKELPKPQDKPNLDLFNTCPHCQSVISKNSYICPTCDRSTDPSGIIPEHEKSVAPDAKGSLALGIAGIFVLGIFLGPAAIYLGNQAKKELNRTKHNPRYKGRGIATVGQILGWIVLILSVFSIYSLF